MVHGRSGLGRDFAESGPHLHRGRSLEFRFNGGTGSIVVLGKLRGRALPDGIFVVIKLLEPLGDRGTCHFIQFAADLASQKRSCWLASRGKRPKRSIRNRRIRVGQGWGVSLYFFVGKFQRTGGRKPPAR